MKRIARLGIGFALLIPMVAFAEATAPIEAGMVVVGTITVNPDGSVKTYTIKGMDKLPTGARQILQATVPRWQFQPISVAGKAVSAETGMSLRIVADIVLGKDATLHVSGAQFGCNARQAKSLLPMACPPGAADDFVRYVSPAYPIAAVRAGVGGEVFLALQIDRSGHVAQVAASQVNLYVRAKYADAFRELLADSAIAAAKKWTLRVPVPDPEAV